MSDEHLKLDNMLCFALYACSREMTRLYRPLLDDLGLTYPQYLTMLVLWEEGEATVKHLGERMYLDSGTLTPLLKRLEQSGLVTRERSRTDERVVVIGLTDAGRDLKAQAQDIPKKLMCKSNLQMDEFNHLKNEFESLLKRMQALKD
ncbi:MarR family winged helix-turn-helix transcriptional regulator [Tumebacillus permanentifrigoris]|uniref:DNA-binding MarR family transcriptional regulator n=1 Tax=Tumebacillus permanentifrigoris TaxID=378543 RepID=A0A316DH21_9BACL|nr:MarR family transcriptional regulator [Tumebacillus permanentifrigoris]PWK16539.1 DNA-binding MarR family transcriptional regulator [Tumebacillus permanentifrigoris]